MGQVISLQHRTPFDETLDAVAGQLASLAQWLAAEAESHEFLGIEATVCDPLARAANLAGEARDLVAQARYELVTR